MKTYIFHHKLGQIEGMRTIHADHPFKAVMCLLEICGENTEIISAEQKECTFVPEDFKTKFDPINENKDYLIHQYNNGRSLSKYDYIIISKTKTYSASSFDGSSKMTGFQTLGLHANTCELAQGMIDSGTPIVDYR